MSEQLSAYTENTPQHIVEDTRQELISRLLDERQKVVTELRIKLLGDKVLGAKELAKIEEEIQKDPNVLVINERLLELTGPRAAGKFAAGIKSQVENLLLGATDIHNVEDFLEDVQHEQRIQKNGPQEIFRREEVDGGIHSFGDMNLRNQTIKDDFFSQSFTHDIEGMIEWFGAFQYCVAEYKHDIAQCQHKLSGERSAYYSQKMLELDTKIQDLLAQKDLESTYNQLYGRSVKARLLLVDYQALHHSCVQEALASEKGL